MTFSKIKKKKKSHIMQLVKVEETINYFITPFLAIKESTMRN